MKSPTSNNAVVRKFQAELESLRLEKEKHETRFTRLFESVPDAIVGINKQGSIVLVNAQAEKLFGYDREALLGKPIERLLPVRYRDKHVPLRRQYFQKPEARPMGTGRELFAMKSDGSEFPVEISLNAIQTPEGALVFSAIRDITDRKQIQTELIRTREEALKASRAKSEFLSQMSHDIRTPLNSILAMADLLEGTPLNEEQYGVIRMCQKSGQQLLSLINNILDVSKMESGDLELDNSLFDLKKFCEDIAARTRVRARQKGLEFEFQWKGPEKEMFHGDSHRLNQVIENLLDNALKFTLYGKVFLNVKLNSKQPGSKKASVSFEVKDSGIGMAPEHIRKIFKRFTQAHSGIRKNFGGSGLGLLIAKQIVEKMDGTIAVESEFGKGACFRVTLPIRIPAPSFPPKNGTERPESRPEGPKKTFSILLAEDSQEIRYVLRAYLKNLPHVLKIAVDGRKAVSEFKRGHFDLVLMDMQMPRCDGYEATRRIRKWEEENKKKRTPILALTAYALNSERERAMAAGCNDYLTKPISKNDFLNAIQKAITNDSEKKTSSIRVEIDSHLRDSIPTYLASRRKETQRLKKALSAKRFEAIRVTAHKLKGHGGSYGFETLSTIGNALEKAAIAKDSELIRKQVEQMEEYLKKVDVVLI